MNEKINSPQYIIKLARELIRNLTPYEEISWIELSGKKINGCKFGRQHPVYRYILDFYCHEKKLAIEVDGEIHQNKYDQDEFRDQYLQSIGIKTIRVTNDEILKDINKVVSMIKAYL